MNTDRLLVLVAAVLFSTGGAAIKYNSLTSWQVACFRSMIAATALLIFVPATRRGWSLRILPVGFAYAAVLLLFVTSTKLTTAANAIFLQSTAPLYLMFLGPLVLHEQLRRTDILLMIAVGAGMSMFFIANESAAPTSPDPFTGNLLAACRGLAWALTVLGLRWAVRHDSTGNAASSAVVLGNLIGCAAALPFAFPVYNPTPANIAVLLYLGIFQVGAAYVCLTRALRRVPAFEASTLVLLEPALNPVWAWLLLSERPGAFAIVGGAIILSATLLNTWWQSRITRVRPSDAA